MIESTSIDKKRITIILFFLQPFSATPTESKRGACRCLPPLLRGGVARIRGRQSKIRVKAEHGVSREWAGDVNRPHGKIAQFHRSAPGRNSSGLGFLPESEPTREKVYI